MKQQNFQGFLEDNESESNVDYFSAEILGESVEPVDEGANIDAKSISHDFRKEIRKSTKELKRAVKRGDKAEAKKYLAETEKLVANYEKNFNAINFEDVSTTVLGYFVYGFGFGLQYFAMCLVPIVGWVAAAASRIITSVKETVSIFNDFKNGEVTHSTLNPLKNAIKGDIAMFKSTVKKYRAEINKM